VEGIDELFRSFSQPDEFHVQAQLELFAWRRMQYQREWLSGYRKSRRKYDDKWAENQRALARTRLARFRAKHKADPAWRAKRNEYHRNYYAQRAA
jgi:hypothetical protein